MILVSGFKRKSEFRVILQEELAPLHSEMDTLRQSVNLAQDKINSDLVSIKASIQNLTERLDGVKKTLTSRIDNLECEQQKYRLKQKNSDKRLEELSDRIVSLESYSRRNKLKFLNIELPNTSSQMDDCEEIVIQLCANCGMTLTNRGIVRAHRTGPTYNNRRAIIVKFIHYKDKVRILKTKPAFREAGVTVVEDFPVEVLTKRKVFKPILQAAFNSNGKYKARLLMDKLIVNGQYYSVSDIDKLPADLNPKHLATVKQENITAFFTEHSPLSNHHPCSLSVEDQHFTSVEQFFMKCKASHFQDHNKVQEIMNTTNPKRAKALGRQIQNFDASS